MKPRRLIEAEGSAGAELALALERIAALEAWKDRQLVVNLRTNERISGLEGPDAEPEIEGWTVKAFAKRVRRSPETIRKWIRLGKIEYTRIGVHPIVDADAVLPPRRRRKSTIRPS